jgi:hypothetical protein
MIPAVDFELSDPALVAAQERDPVVQRYRRLFALLDWSVVPKRDPRRAWPGWPPHPVSAYIKALLIKICEGLRSITELRRFLLAHPLLALEVGFRPAPDPTQPFGFAVAASVPTDRWLRQRQQSLDPAMLTALLAGTVRALRSAAPDLGATIAIDGKHLYAWVAENNPTAAIAHAFDPQRRPPGDPDCRLGVKRRSNGQGGQGKEYLWGYGWGIAAATHPVCGDLVVAEWTQPFNHQDITWFHPVYAQAVATLGQRPTNVTADAAFDAWHVYNVCATTGGLAAIPRNERGGGPLRDAQGLPLCARGLTMTPGRQFQHEDGYRAQDHHCPLLRPARTGAVCAHATFATGGCHKVINLEPGGRMRAELDRSSAAYRAIYRQRTCAERINAQATERLIARPKVRRLAGVRRLNTLTAIAINLAALERLAARTPPAAPLC